MPLLPFSNCDVVPPEHGCGFLYEAAEALLAAGLVGLEPFIPDGECDSFDAYVSMNAPNAEFYDALSIHLVSWGPTPEAQRRNDSMAGCVPLFPTHVATWDMRLWENQYPAAQQIGDEIRVPPPDQLGAVNEHLYAHGIALHNALMAANVNGTLGLPYQFTKTAIGDLTPLGPQGLAAGWRITIVTRTD